MTATTQPGITLEDQIAEAQAFVNEAGAESVPVNAAIESEKGDSHE